MLYFLNMAPLRKFAIQFYNLVNINKTKHRLKISNSEKFYSVFPATYAKPVYTKNDQKKLQESGEITEIINLSIKPAFTDETSSEFHDPVVNKFLCFLMREGKKETARMVLERTFENVKRIQLEQYNKSKPHVQAEMELDPMKILYKAIENSTPVLELQKMKRGGQTYQVPIPLNQKRATFLGMNWLIRAGQDKPMKTPIWERLAYELIDASKNQGRVIKKKQELYRQCEANRSYAHFRWQ